MGADASDTQATQPDEGVAAEGAAAPTTMAESARLTPTEGTNAGDPPDTPVPPAPSVPTTAADRTFKVIDDQLAEERATKTRLEDRAHSVITSSGTLTTLLFALAALVTQMQGYKLPTAAAVLLFLAVIAFLYAITKALMASRPTAYQEVTLESLRKIETADALNSPATEAAPKIAKALVDIIEGARNGNATKANDLKDAVTAELIAAVIVAAAVAVVLYDAAF